MANFKYAPMFQLGKDETEYYLLTKDYVSVSEFEPHSVTLVSCFAVHTTSRLPRYCVTPRHQTTISM